MAFQMHGPKKTNGGPAAAAKVLGHADATGALAWKNYIDRSQLDDDLPMPPAIGPAT